MENILSEAMSDFESFKLRNFLNIDDILSKINQKLQTSQGVVLYGEDGCGKNTTAIQYGNFFKKNLNGIIIWINAKGVQKARLEIYLYTLKMIHRTNTYDEMIDYLCEKLNNLNKNVLFIFSNVQNYQNIEKYIEKVKQFNFKAIITTANTLIDIPFESIEIRQFTSNDSQLYLNSILSDILDENQIRKVVEIIMAKKDKTVSPYYLDKVNAYIKKNSTQDSVDLIKQLQSLEKIDLVTDLIFNLIASLEDCFQALVYISLLDQDFTQESLLIDILKVNETKLRKAINKLESMNLVDSITVNKKNGVKIHRLTQEAFISYRQRFMKNQIDIHTIRLNILEYLDQRFMIENKFSSEAFYYFFHAEKILAHDWDSEYSKASLRNNERIKKLEANLFYKLGMFYYSHLSMYDDSLKNFIGSLNLRQSLNEEDNDQKLIAILRSISYCYDRLKEKKKTIEFCIKYLKLKKNYDMDREYASMLNLIGNCYNDLGEHTQAINYETEALNLIRQLTQDSLEYVKYLNSLSITYQSCERFEEALKCDEEILQIRLNHLASNHPYVGNSYHNIGLDHFRMGDYNKALEYFKKSYKARKTFYKGNHDDILTSLDGLRFVYEKLEKPEKSLYYDTLYRYMKMEMDGKYYDLEEKQILKSSSTSSLGQKQDSRTVSSISIKSEKSISKENKVLDIEKWDKTKVKEWLEKSKNLNISLKLRTHLEELNGKNLLNYLYIFKENPEFFKSYLKSKIGDKYLKDADLKKIDDELTKLLLES